MRDIKQIVSQRSSAVKSDLGGMKSPTYSKLSNQSELKDKVGRSMADNRVFKTDIQHSRTVVNRSMSSISDNKVGKPHRKETFQQMRLRESRSAAAQSAQSKMSKSLKSSGYFGS